ncbi:Serine/threonine-protein phosphatase 2A regulatory subunit B'' subunit beta [Varanus komodoensis]|nr:Serine/threonine-protein phosphatase 2A regulatory subunit B'' subunit beta [Varanus komodoensis]
MPAIKVLQPVLKMKVDELFLFWLSETATQVMLKDYLRNITNEEKIECGSGDASSNEQITQTNCISKQSMLGNLMSPLTPSSPPHLSTALPLGNPSSPRGFSNIRGLRRSSSSRGDSAVYWTQVPGWCTHKHYMKSESMRIKEISLRQDPDLRKELALLARGCDFVLPSRFKKRLKAFQQVQVQSKKEEPLTPSLSQTIPTFYFPYGCPKEKVNIDAVIAKIEKTFSQFPNERATLEDMGKVAKDVVNSHPSLVFLKEASEFHSRYITTNVALLEEEVDINQLTEYFSYEHFYVIYCKFWELDTDHDLYIDPKDLARHNDHAISNRMIERIFSGAVTRGRKVQKEGKLSYADFVWFLISEEDKKTPTSIEYWFRCMDLDGDGVLSMYELQYFYEEQCQKLDNMAIEPLPFEDCLCQMLDLVKPECEGKITLRDLKKCKMANVFFDTFFNIEKYLDHEQKDQFSMLRGAENENQEMTDWEKYAAEEYDVLVAEEAASDQWNDCYEPELNPCDQKTNILKYQMEKRPFFDMPSHLADVDLDEFDYEDDFE